MPLLRMTEIVHILLQHGIESRIGSVESDIPSYYWPYFERWLGNRDGFIRLHNSNLDYVGSEDVVRIGPFYNIYCIIENHQMVESDVNHHRLIDSMPYYNLVNGKVTSFGWSGSILAKRLTEDSQISSDFINTIMNEETRSLSVRVIDFGVLIESRVWDKDGFISIYGMVDKIAEHSKALLNQVHIGEKMGT